MHTRHIISLREVTTDDQGLVTWGPDQMPDYLNGGQPWDDVLDAAYAIAEDIGGDVQMITEGWDYLVISPDGKAYRVLREEPAGHDGGEVMNHRIRPVPCLNGDQKQTLLDQITRAHHALMEAAMAMSQAAPNGRNYQLGGDLKADRAESDRRIEAVQTIAHQYWLDAVVLAGEEE